MTETVTRIMAAAQSYQSAGLCIIPISVDGSKAPDGRVLPQVWDEAEKRKKPSWKPFQEARPTQEQVQSWFGNGTARGIALVHGRVSGNSEVLDFDKPGLYEQFKDVCREQGLTDVLESLTLIETPSGGRHLLYRCLEPVAGNQKLAEAPDRKTLIETRGEGGYTVAPGSPAACHKNERPYRFLRGRPDTTPTISAEDRAALLDIARLFNEYADPITIVDAPRQKRDTGDGLRPGDDYNNRGDYESLLEQCGWSRKGQAGDKTLWQRPGKNGRGLSATSNYGGSNLFYVFSSNAAPFAPQKAYSPFAVLALLEHGGDYSESARALAGEGYGEPLPAKNTYPALSRSGKNSSPGGTVPPGELPDSPGAAWEPPVLFTDAALPPFPLEALPPVLSAFVSEVAASVQVPVDMAAMMALGIVGAAGARTCMVQVGQTHQEPLNLFVGVVMPPGSRKSGCLDALQAPLKEAEREQTAAEMPRIIEAAEKRAVEDKRLSHLRDQAAKAKTGDEAEERGREVAELAGALTQVPFPTRLIAEDVTPEAAAKLASEQGGTLAIVSAEGGLFGNLAGRYQNGQPNLDFFLHGHAGEGHRVDRKGSPPVDIPRVCLSVLLAIQPGVLASLSETAAFGERGLIARFLFSIPEDLVGTRFYTNRRIDPFARTAYHAAVKTIAFLPSAATEDDPGVRRLLRLDGEALTLWAEYADAVERRQAEGGDLYALKYWASKLAGEVARIAGGLHLAEYAGHGCPWNRPISTATIAAAWCIGEYLIPHAQAAYGDMGEGADGKIARRVLRWVVRSKVSEFSLRDCYHAHRNLSQTDLITGLTVLCERGFLRPLNEPKRHGAGRPKTTCYQVNPSVSPESIQN